MEGRIVHYKDRFWLGPFAAMRQQLLNEILRRHCQLIPGIRVQGQRHPVRTLAGYDISDHGAIEQLVPAPLPKGTIQSA